MDKGSEFSRSDLVFGDLSFARKEEEWEWDFDNSGEYYRRKSVIFKVGAYDFKS